MNFRNTLPKLLIGAVACFGAIAPSFAQSLTDCNVPTVDGDAGPIKKSLYVVGTFPGANWMHIPARKMSYKGKGVYQLVIDEKAGPVIMQYATLNWSPQYSAKGMSMEMGKEVELVPGRMGNDTNVNLPNDGKYVWSIEIDESKKGLRAVVAPCK